MIGKRSSVDKGLVIIYAVLLLLSVVCIYPVLWIVMSSFNVGDSLYSSTLIPDQMTLNHYAYLLGETPFLLWVANTFKIAVFNMLISLFVVTSAAYAFSRFRFRGRNTAMMILLVLQIFPSFMAMIAVYILLLQAQLLDSHLGLILVYAAGGIPIGVWIVKGYFDGIPRSLEESAKIDGASHTTIFWRIMAPLSFPILTFISLISFIAPWMDFIFPRLILRSDEKKTLAVGLYEMVTDVSKTQFTTFAAGAVLVAIPITLLFLFLQRYLVEGLTAGASKG